EGKPRTARRGALGASAVGGWRACGDGAGGGADVRARRACVEPRPAYAVARVSAARHVGRGRRVGRVGLRGFSGPRQAARSVDGARGFPFSELAALRIPAAGKIREGARGDENGGAGAETSIAAG